MLLDISFVFSHFGLVCLVVFVIVLLKIFATAIPAMLAGFSVRTSLIAGGTIAQVGEFSFVLLSRAANLGLLQHKFYLLLLGTTAISLFMTPVMFKCITRAMNWLPKA